MIVKTKDIHCYIMLNIGGGPVEKNDKQIGFRVSEELKRRIEVQAEKEKRSVSNLIIKVMTEYLEQHENQG
mgnify:FL=1